ncbi:hypothetical protein CWI36_3004p0010, partial [Hamiltosporidium magnivora]
STQCFFREDLYFKLTNYKNLLVHKSERYKYYLYILSRIHLKLFIQTKSENEIAEVYQNIENNICKLIVNHVSYNAVLFNKNVEIIDKNISNENREDSKINLDKFNQNSKLHVPSFVIRQLFLSDSILASGYHIKVKYLNGTIDSVPTISLEDSNNKEYKYILIKMPNYFDLKIKIENLPWEFNNNDEFVNEFKDKEFNLIFMFKTNNIIEVSDVDWLRMNKKIRLNVKSKETLVFEVETTVEKPTINIKIETDFYGNHFVAREFEEKSLKGNIVFNNKFFRLKSLHIFFIKIKTF